MDQLPYGVRLDSTYEMAREGVLFTQYLFTAQVAQVDAHLSGFRLKEAYQIALQLMDMTMASLKSFFEVAERILKRKTLPNPPTDTIVNVDSEDEHDLKVMDGVGTSILPKSEGEKKPTLPPASITEESATTTVVADDNQESCLSSTGMRDGVPTALSSLARRARMITRLLACAGSAPTRFNANATEYTLTTNECADDSVRSVHLEAKSQMGPVSPPGGKRTLQNDNTSESQKSPKRNAYSIRQSLLVFSDPEEPQNNVEMPRPVGDAFDININEKGVIVGASLSALIRILTSKDAVTDHELTEMFFVCFRFFSSPMEVYDKLVGRYDEQPPGPLTTSQSRVWEQEARLVRFRVAKVFLMWLDLHWRHETDKDVFEPLLNFTFKRMAADLPFELSKKITEALHKCAGTGHNYRGRRLRRRLEMQENVLKSEVPPSTSFKLSKATDRGGSSTLEVLDFNSTRGRQELAIQLTINASQLYRLVDPEDAIIFWRNGENKEVGRTISDLVDFEKSICFFVTNSILDRAGPAARAAMAGFWIDVASVSPPNRPAFISPFSYRRPTGSRDVYGCEILAPAHPFSLGFGVQALID
jgi:hypothetical protein